MWKRVRTRSESKEGDDDTVRSARMVDLARISVQSSDGDFINVYQRRAVLAGHPSLLCMRAVAWPRHQEQELLAAFLSVF